MKKNKAKTEKKATIEIVKRPKAQCGGKKSGCFITLMPQFYKRAA
ncbi:hypothetical protein ACTHGU_08370 [Chitinophagaceae bacterium MMS25-I14]